MSDFDRMMGDSLKGIRNEHLKQIEASVPAARHQIGSKLRRRRFNFVIGGVALAAAAVAAIVFIAQTVPKVDRTAPIRPAGEPVVMARIDVPGVGVMEPGFDRLWVSHEEGLVGIDPSKSAVEEDWPVRNVDGMSANSQAMYTIDMDKREIHRLGIGNNEAAFAVGMEGTPTVVASSEEAVWVAAAVGPVGDSQIFAYTPELEMPGDSAIQVQRRVVADMTHAEDALWIAASVSDKGPGTASRSNMYEVGRYLGGGSEGTVWPLSTDEGSAAEVVVGEGAAWVLRHPTRTGGNTITRVDLETDKMVERAVNFRESIESIAVGEGYLWVTTAPLGMDMPDDATATLHRIDPKTLEAVGEPIEVSGPGSKVAVGYGFVWVSDPNAKQIVQIDPFGSTSPEPAPSTPEPEETEPAPSDDAKCRTFLPFASSDGSLTLELGSGGQRDVALRDQSPAALVHFARPDGAFVDVVPGVPISPPDDWERLRVIGTRGMLHAIDHGYAVTFGMGGCKFQLIADGFDENEVRNFVQTLGLRGHLDAAQDAFTIWPGEMPEAAYATCVTAQGSQLGDAQETAVAFAKNALQWDNAEIEEGFMLNAKSGWEGYRVLRDGSEGSPRVLVMVREVAADCWHVNSVRPANQDDPTDEENGLGISHRDGETTVAFDLAREAGSHRVESVRLVVGPGQALLSREEFERKGFIRVTDKPLTRPTALLVFLLDKDDEIVGAIGQALPSGDFAAG